MSVMSRQDLEGRIAALRAGIDEKKTELQQDQEARDLLHKHPEEYILFGSDSPWEDQTVALQQLRDKTRQVLTTS